MSKVTGYVKCDQLTSRFADKSALIENDEYFRFNHSMKNFIVEHVLPSLTEYEDVLITREESKIYKEIDKVMGQAVLEMIQTDEEIQGFETVEVVDGNGELTGTQPSTGPQYPLSSPTGNEDGTQKENRYSQNMTKDPMSELVNDVPIDSAKEQSKQKTMERENSGVIGIIDDKKMINFLHNLRWVQILQKLQGIHCGITSMNKLFCLMQEFPKLTQTHHFKIYRHRHRLFLKVWFLQVSILKTELVRHAKVLPHLILIMLMQSMTTITISYQIITIIAITITRPQYWGLRIHQQKKQ
jgi:hypothetical protein